MSKIINFIKKRWIWILAVLLLFAVIVSSIEIYKEEVLNIDPDIKYKQKSTLYFAAERFDTLNPIVSQSEDVYYISKLLYDSLFDFDDNMNATPELVEKYTVDTEKASVYIKLKKGVKWHSGKALKSDDVRFTVNAVKQAGSKSPYYEKCSRIMYVNVKNNREFTIFFNNNYNCSLDILTFPIVPSAGYSTPYQFVTDTDGFKPVGTGMYMYSSYDYLKKLKLKPNKDYYADEVTNKIQVNILPDASYKSSLTEINEVTCYIDKSTDRYSIVKDKKLNMYDMISGQVEFVVFNTKKPYLASKEVRKAIACGIDTERIIRNSYASDAVLTDSLYYPNFLGVLDTGGMNEYDYDKASQMLTKAAIKDFDGDGFLEDVYGNRITLTILVKKSNAQRVSACKNIAKNMETLGFKVDVKALPSNQYKQAMASRNFDLLVAGCDMEETYDLREFFNGKNDWGYYNAELLTKSRELERLYTEEKQQQKYTQMKDALLDEMPYYALCYKKMGLVGISTFTADKLPTFNNIYKNCNTWSWKEREN